jgi:hypothetical protein
LQNRKFINNTFTYFKPTNRVRVKLRASLGTTAAFHSATAADSLNQWTGRTITWTTGGSK